MKTKYKLRILSPKLVPLALLGLGDLGNHQLLPGQLLQQLLQDLPVVEVLLNVLNDYPLKNTNYRYKWYGRQVQAEKR